MPWCTATELQRDLGVDADELELMALCGLIVKRTRYGDRTPGQPRPFTTQYERSTVEHALGERVASRLARGGGG